ncbi:MAG TPA: stage III sporulation protein AE [Bacillota bacterium]
MSPRRAVRASPAALLGALLLAVIVLLPQAAGASAQAAPPPDPEVRPVDPADPAPGRDAREQGDAAPETLADEIRRLAERHYEQLDTGEVLHALERLREEAGGGLTAVGPQLIRSVIRGEGVPLEAQDVLAAAAGIFFGAVVDHAALLGRLVLLAVLLALLRLLQSAFAGETVAAVADAAVYLAMVAVGLVVLWDAFDTIRGVITDLVDFMLAMLPTLVTLMAGVGAFASAGLLSPASVMLVNGVGVVAAQWVLPLIFTGTVLQVVNHLPGRIHIERLASLVRQAGLVLLSLAFVVFLGVMSVQGAASGVVDGVLLRTAKFGAGTFIPVLGGMFADAAELVIGSSLLLKNAVGIFGLVTVAALTAIPLLKVLALVLVFRLAAALVQPIADGIFVQALGAMSDGLVLAAVTAAAVALMFFFALTVLLGVGNAAVMLR